MACCFGVHTTSLPVGLGQGPGAWLALMQPFMCTSHTGTLTLGVHWGLSNDLRPRGRWKVLTACMCAPLVG